MNIDIDDSSGIRALVIRDNPQDKDGKEYEIKMIKRNNIAVFLPLNELHIDNATAYEYDITSMTSLKELSERNPLKLEELIMLIDSLKECRESIKEYLLSKEGLILDPRYIFYDRKDKHLKFCFYPWNDTDEFGNYTQLAEFLLAGIDYSDELCVKLAYDVYAAVLNKNYELTKLIAEEMQITKVDVITKPIQKEEQPIPIEEGKEKTVKRNVRIPTLTPLSIICLTLNCVLLLCVTILFVFSRKLFFILMKNILSDIRVVSVLVLVLSIFTYFPLMNITDILRAKRINRRLQKTC